MSTLGWVTGLEPHCLVVGLGEEDGMLKVYLGHRWKGIYTLVDDPDARAEIERAWANTMQHVLIPRPPDEALYQDPPA